MYRKVGEEFKYKDNNLKVTNIKVIEGCHPDCIGCYFKDKPCLELQHIRGHCTSFYRKDNKEVMFEEVKGARD